ncbi:MAG: LysM peptidoglycan-binding domain-containing protein [Myxococcaceae bacterium]|nr:MAG: LysM peptidoglycan-binding domain-containing protein [Myxococcaceae bacterium]
MSVRPVSPGSPEVSGPSLDAASWVVQRGDTLSGIAHQLQRQGVPGTTAELIRALVRLNGIANPDHIEVGQVLTLPPRAERPRIDEDLVSVLGRTARHGAETFRMQVDEQRARLENALLRWVHRVPPEPAPARPPAVAPRFRQSDPAWRSERLGVSGEGPTLAQAGCAVTACAMALSRIGGTVLTPDALLRHLRASGGFQGPLLDWSAAGAAIPRRPRASPADLDCARVDRELDAGHPVLLRVVHDVQGRARQHWICVTGRDASTGQYTADDPATGRATVLVREGPALASLDGERVRYTSDGRMVTFDPGTTRRG